MGAGTGATVGVGDHVCRNRLEDRGRRGLVMTVPVVRGRLLEEWGERREGRRSCTAVPVRVGDGIGVGVGWVQDAGTPEARLCIGAPDAPCVAGGGVTSSVNYIG